MTVSVSVKSKSSPTQGIDFSFCTENINFYAEMFSIVSTTVNEFTGTDCSFDLSIRVERENERISAYKLTLLCDEPNRWKIMRAVNPFKPDNAAGYYKLIDVVSTCKLKQLIKKVIMDCIKE